MLQLLTRRKRLHVLQQHKLNMGRLKLASAAAAPTAAITENITVFLHFIFRFFMETV